MSLIAMATFFSMKFQLDAFEVNFAGGLPLAFGLTLTALQVFQSCVRPQWMLLPK